MEPNFVVDIGSASTKVGFSGEDHPSWVFPTATEFKAKYGKNTESVEMPLYQPNTMTAAALKEDVPLMHRGLVQDWDEMQKFYREVIDEVGFTTLEVEKQPVLLVDSPRASIIDRAHWADLLFGYYGVPSLCIGNSASLSIFAHGKTTGTVVDCGAGLVTSVPVFEGLALTHACVDMECAGQDVTLKLKKLLAEYHGLKISFGDALQLKERVACCRTVAPAPVKKRGAKKKEINPEDLETLHLPDGQEVQIDRKLFQECTESLFVNKDTTYGGLGDSVYESLILCDDSISGDLRKNIIIAGGTSMLPGLGDRLLNDLDTLHSKKGGWGGEAEEPIYRVSPSSSFRESGYTNQRKHAPWIGASIFASFDSFSSLRVTKQEYDENGEAILLTKCF